MQFQMSFEHLFDKPIERVWRGITDPRGLKTWLLDTNFVAEVGRDFEMWCTNDDGSVDTYECRVLEMIPPTRMVWSWARAGGEAAGTTIVAFALEAVEGGTKLTLSHSGHRDPKIVDKFESGWPAKLRDLAASLSEADDA
jgi:uncharacterized protein YndB with AHSA1/START domain